jgi:ABC-type antimicrobial peptide transport system permease subunit
VPGLFGAWLFSGFLQGLVFGVSPLDPVSLAGSVVLLAGTTVAAAYVPALRASRVDPLVALREE